MFGITDPVTYLLGVIFIVLLPGPNSLYVLSVAGRRGIADGYRAAAAIFVGDAVLMALSAAGMGSALALYPPAFWLLKVAGAGYLGYLGVGLLRQAWQTWAGRAVVEGSDLPRLQRDERPFRRALLISLINPKAILFFISFFIQFVDRSYPEPAVTFLALAAILQVVSVIYLTVLIFAGARIANAFRRRQRVAAAAGGGVGALFIGFGAKLALATV